MENSGLLILFQDMLDHGGCLTNECLLPRVPFQTSFSNVAFLGTFCLAEKSSARCWWSHGGTKQAGAVLGWVNLGEEKQGVKMRNVFMQLLVFRDCRTVRGRQETTCKASHHRHSSSVQLAS